MLHLFRLFKWIDYRHTPDSPSLRYRKEWTLGQDDYGNAVMYRKGKIYFH